MAVYSSKALLAGLKDGSLNFTEPFKSPKGELLTKLNGRLCYIAKTSREAFEKCEITGYCVDVATDANNNPITLSDGNQLLMFHRDHEEVIKKGNWH